jgi:hypothetical protein
MNIYFCKLSLKISGGVSEDKGCARDYYLRALGSYLFLGDNKNGICDKASYVYMDTLGI